MAKFVYLGDKAETVVFGTLFVQGVESDVSDAKAIAKLRANSHFSEVFEGVQVVEAEQKRGPGRPRKVEQE